MLTVTMLTIFLRFLFKDLMNINHFNTDFCAKQLVRDYNDHISD